MPGPVAVYGVLSELTDIPLSANPELIFYPSQPATNIESFSVGSLTRTAGGALYATKGARTTPGSSGYFTIDLHPTSDLSPANRGAGPVTYSVRIEWNDSSGSRTGMDIIRGLQVTEAGGAIGAMLKTSLPGWILWAGPTLEPQYNTPGNYWWNTDTDDIWKVV